MGTASSSWAGGSGMSFTRMTAVSPRPVPRSTQSARVSVGTQAEAVGSTAPCLVKGQGEAFPSGYRVYPVPAA